MSIIKYLIIEDESLAFEEVKRMMDKLRPDYVMAGWAQTIAQSVTLLHSQNFDFILADISLADGLCFEIFEQVDPGIPVIFTTAYDEYAIKAFKVNGIDYLLKPIEPDMLEQALVRFEKNMVKIGTPAVIAQLANGCVSSSRKSRLMVQCGDSYMAIEVSDIAFFMSEDKYTYLYKAQGGRYIVNYSLDALEGMLDPALFFRVSRHCIASAKSVQRCTRSFGGRLRLHCMPALPEDTYVSRSRAKDFIDWLDGK